MPKPFSDTERETIRAALLAAAERRFAREGLRAVRIDDLCRDVGIAKGSFYGFFPSKEELFMQVAETREATHRAEMMAALDDRAGSVAQRVGRLFDLIMDKIETDPMLAVLREPGLLAQLVRRLPPERLAETQASDRAFTARLAERWTRSGFAPPVTAETLVALMSLMLSLFMQREVMGEDTYRSARAEMRRLFLMRLAGETP